MKKLALITGGTKGIGKAVALSLGKKGYNLILTYASDPDSAIRTRDELLKHTQAVEIHLLDANITKKKSIDKIEEYLLQNHLMLDTVIFNAGLTCRDAFGSIRESDWKNVFYGNIHFPVFLLQRITGRINKGGSVVFTGSLMGIEPHSVSLAYGVSKSAVHALVRNLVKFLSPLGIRVNAVAPGFVDTEWQKNKPAEIRRSIESKIALGRFCRPEEVADAYIMLIENACFNGEIITIDGGYSYK